MAISYLWLSAVMISVAYSFKVVLKVCIFFNGQLRLPMVLVVPPAACTTDAKGH